MGGLTAVFGSTVRYTVQVATDEANRGRVFGLLFAVFAVVNAPVLPRPARPPLGSSPLLALAQSGGLGKTDLADRPCISWYGGSLPMG